MQSTIIKKVIKIYIFSIIRIVNRHFRFILFLAGFGLLKNEKTVAAAAVFLLLFLVILVNELRLITSNTASQDSYQKHAEKNTYLILTYFSIMLNITIAYQINTMQLVPIIIIVPLLSSLGRHYPMIEQIFTKDRLEIVSLLGFLLFVSILWHFTYKLPLYLMIQFLLCRLTLEFNKNSLIDIGKYKILPEIKNDFVRDRQILEANIVKKFLDRHSNFIISFDKFTSVSFLKDTHSRQTFAFWLPKNEVTLLVINQQKNQINQRKIELEMKNESWYLQLNNINLVELRTQINLILNINTNLLDNINGKPNDYFQVDYLEVIKSDVVRKFYKVLDQEKIKAIETTAIRSSKGQTTSKFIMNSKQIYQYEGDYIIFNPFLMFTNASAVFANVKSCLDVVYCISNKKKYNINELHERVLLDAILYLIKSNHWVYAHNACCRLEDIVTAN